MAAAVQQQTERKLVNPFCRDYVPQAELDYSSQGIVYRVQTMKVDPDTLIVSPVFEKVDIQAEIDACRSLCGVEQMQRLLANGLAKPADFAAKPEDFHDMTQIPADVHSAAKLADLRSEQLAKIAKEIGIQETEELTPELFEQRLKAYIAANWKEPQASPEVK